MIKLTRHAKNNMRLYKITKDDIKHVIEQAEEIEVEKDKFIAIKKIKNKFQNLPLKIVYSKIEDMNIIITAYPIRKLHKGR
ncbi:MAG: DUF4258 domain-containing protein [bacterium]